MANAKKNGFVEVERDGQLYRVHANALKTASGQTNAQFAKQNSAFRKACQAAGVEPTPRQASKYRNKRGAAYNAK